MVPVILINWGCQSHLHPVIMQAQKFNKNVFLIGDNTNGHLASHFNISDYSEKASNFGKLYQHLSTNGHDVELFCFQRWFVLEEFMARRGLKRCLYIDSDILLYANAEQEIKNYDQFDFTLSHRCCGSTSFFKYEGLSKLCNFIMETYSNKSSYEYEKISSHYYIRQKHNLGGGVCDMTLLEFYSYKICGSIGEMMHIVNGATWDHNINESDQGFEMKNGIKNIQFHPIEKIPTCKHFTGEDIKFKSLHFQGPAKRYINQYVSQ